MLNTGGQGELAVPEKQVMNPNTGFINEEIVAEDASCSSLSTCTPSTSSMPPAPGLLQKGVVNHRASLPEMGGDSFIKQNLNFENPNFASDYAERFAKYNESQFSTMQSAPAGSTASGLLQNAYR